MNRLRTLNSATACDQVTLVACAARASWPRSASCRSAAPRPGSRNHSQIPQPSTMLNAPMPHRPHRQPSSTPANWPLSGPITELTSATAPYTSPTARPRDELSKRSPMISVMTGWAAA